MTRRIKTNITQGLSAKDLKDYNLNDTTIASVLKNLPVAVVIFNNSRLLYLNDRVLALLLPPKNKKNDISNQSVYDYILPQYHKPFKTYNALILSGKESQPFELKIKNGKNEILDVEFTSSATIFNNKSAIQSVITNISSKIKITNQLIETENDLRVILQGIDEVVYYTDFSAEKKLKFISQKVHETFGVNPEVFTKNYVTSNSNILKHIHPDDLNFVKECALKLKREKKPQSFIYRFKNFETKQYLWLQERIIPQFGPNKTYIGNLGITRDITKEIIKEQHLKQNEKTFKLLSQNASDIIYLYEFKPGGNYTYVSDSVKKILGYLPSDFYNDPLFGNKIIFSEDQHIIKNSNILIKKKSDVRKTLDKSLLRYVKKDGTLAWLETRYSTIKDAPGNIVTLIAISRDVTKEKEAEILRKETEEKFKLIAENSNDIIFFFTYHPQPKYIYISPSIKKILGYSANQFYNNPLLAQSMVPDKKSYRAFEDGISKLQKNNTLAYTTCEFEYKTKAGKLIWLEDTYSPIYDNGGKIKFILGVSRDITIEKKYRTELEQKRNDYQNLLDSSPIGILIHYNGKCIYCNKTALKIFEEDNVNSLIEKNLFNYFHLPKQRKVAISRMTRASKGEELTDLTYKIRTAKNIVIDIELKTVPFIYIGKQCVQTIISNLSDEKKIEKERVRALVAEDLNRELIKEINYRKKIQQELVTQTNKYEAIFDNTSHLIWSVNRSLEYTSFNNNYYNYIKTIFGFTVKIGDHIGEVKTATNQNVNYKFWVDKYTKVFSDKKDNIVEYFEIRNTDVNGKEHFREIYLHPIRQLNGAINEIAIIAQDVTDRKLAEHKISDQASKLESIFESSAHLVWTVDSNFNVTSYNHNFVEVFSFNYGIKPQLNKPVHLYIPKQHKSDYQNYWYPLYKKVFSGSSLKFERKQQNDKGNAIYKEIYLNPIRNSSGEITEIACLAHDITENKQFEKQIVEQSAKLKAIFESGDQLMWTIGMDKKLTSFNQNYSKAIFDLYGYYPELGKTMRSDKTAELHNIWDDRYVAAFDGKQVEFISERTNLSGKKIIRQMLLYPIKDNENKVIEISGIGFDITENKKNEERITQSLKEKEILLKEVHHRVKNNMQVISSILNLQSSYVKDSYALNLLKECQNRIKSMAFIHESLYQTKNFESVNFSEYIATLTKNLVHTYSINAKKVKLILTLDSLYLSLDSSIPCGLIINEIVSNSLKYAFPDNRDGIIFVTLKVEKNIVKIEAGDNGIGIPLHIDVKQTETLGLQLVDTLVEQINGTLVLDRTKGTKFIIEFNN